MNKYELVVVLSTENKKLKEAVDSFIEQSGFKVADQEDMGSKTLAYKIDGEESANYYKYTLEGEGTGVKKLELALRLEVGVLRYLTIALTPKLEKVRAEMAVVRAEIQAKAKKNDKLKADKEEESSDDEAKKSEEA